MTDRKQRRADRLAKAARWAREIAEGTPVALIAFDEKVSRTRVYQLLSEFRNQTEPLPVPAPPPTDDGERPAWSYPDAELLAVAREGRREIEAAWRPAATDGP
jgi:hypothetical protein